MEQTLLYDFYGELLTPHQKQVYEDVVFNDLSLSEIAQEQGISRQGVHDMVKRCNKILTGYEEKLHLIAKFMKAKEMITNINTYARDIRGTEDSQVILSKIEMIENVSNALLEEF